MVDRNNPSDDQWWALLRLVKANPELLLCHYTNKGTQAIVQDKWTTIASELNSMKRGMSGCSKPADGWRNSWNSLKARSRKAAGDKNRKKRNPLFQKVYELVGPSLVPEPVGEQEQQREEEQAAHEEPNDGHHLLQAMERPHDFNAEFADLMWAGLEMPADGALPEVQVKQEIHDEYASEPAGQDQPAVITIDDTPIKTPVLVEKEKHLHTPPSGPGAIPKRRLNYERVIGPAHPTYESQLLAVDDQHHELTKAIIENTATMLKLINKLDNVSLLPL